MASRRLLVSAVTADALAEQEIRDVEVPSIVSLWAGAVTVTDTLGLKLGGTDMMAEGTANVRAAALGLIDVSADQLVFAMVIGGGRLRIPVSTLTTSLIFLLTVDPII